MKNKKGFTLVELLAVIVILAVIILIAINAVLPQMEKARKNSFADEVMGYAKAAETKYVSDSSDDDAPAMTSSGICYDLSESSKGLTGEYISKKDSNYEGIVIIKKKTANSNLFVKYAFITSGKYYFNSTVTDTTTAAAKIVADETGALAIGKLNNKNAADGGKSNLSYKTCCEYYKALDSNYVCE